VIWVGVTPGVAAGVESASAAAAMCAINGTRAYAESEA
jgi:hypothetical protein